MPSPNRHRGHREATLKRNEGCFWVTGFLGAFIILALIIGHWTGSPQLDGPFGALIWLIVQGSCFFICIVGAIRAHFDHSLNRSQRLRRWAITLFPPVALLLMALLTSR